MPMMRSMMALTLVAVILATVAAGCGNDSARPGDTPAVTPSQSPSNDLTPSSATPPATPSLSPSKADDVKLVDVSELAAAIAEAVASKNVSALIALSVTRPLPCVEVGSASHTGPVCRPGDLTGTAYRALPVARCSGGWSADLDQVFGTLVDRAGPPVILARLGPPMSDWPSDWPYGEEVLVFSPRSPGEIIQTAGVYTEAGAIVRVQLGCRSTDKFFAFEYPGATVIWRNEPGK